MEEKDERNQISWSQTLIAVTKQNIENAILKHKDIELRQIKSILTNIEEPFDIYEEDYMSQEKAQSAKQIINSRKLKEWSTKDAGNQTFQIIRTIPNEYKHEASQTMYMTNLCLPVKYSRNMICMNVSRMPVFMDSCSSQTIITIAPIKLHYEAVKHLSNHTYEKHQENSLQNSVDKETIILEILNFLLSHVFWISDSDQTPIETKCEEIQTVIWHNRAIDIIVLDNETQTKLSCEPRYSNSKLLAEYEETKNFMQSWLWECLGGIESRIIIDDLIDEIIVKGADRLKYPMKNQVIQTVATYKSCGIREEEMLRKLRIPVIVDPFEASIVIMPLIDDLLHLTYDEISRNIWHVVKYILDLLVQQTVLIGFKFAQIRKQSQPDSFDQIFDRRRKKIIESMLKKETKIAVTQTRFAGVHEVAKIKEPKEILCSVCAKQSVYHWRVAAQEENLPPESTRKLLCTQDILLAYNPCYVVATAAEEAKISHIQSKKKSENLITAQLPIPQCATPLKTDDVSNKIVNIPRKNIQIRDSINGWTHIIDNTLVNSWSLRGSASNATNVITASTTTRSISKCCKKSSQSESVPSLQAMKALQILKNTFCTRDFCLTMATQKRHLFDKIANEKYMMNVKKCTLLNLDQYHRQPISNINNKICARPRVDKFRTVPARTLSKSWKLTQHNPGKNFHI